VDVSECLPRHRSAHVHPSINNLKAAAFPAPSALIDSIDTLEERRQKPTMKSVAAILTVLAGLVVSSGMEKLS
jgi:hypothetical protein